MQLFSFRNGHLQCTVNCLFDSPYSLSSTCLAGVLLVLSATALVVTLPVYMQVKHACSS